MFFLQEASQQMYFYPDMFCGLLKTFLNFASNINTGLMKLHKPFTQLVTKLYSA